LEGRSSFPLSTIGGIREEDFVTEGSELKVAEIDLARQEKWRTIVTLFEDRRPEL